MGRKIKRRINSKIILTYTFMAISIIVFAISLISLLNWKQDSDNTKKIIGKINEFIEIDEQEGSTDGDSSLNIYTEYQNIDVLNINFDSLLEYNKDTIGWVKVNGTSINYPFVQTSDNEYYLNHSYDKSKNNAGWVFMDYKNENFGINQNTILYAHARRDGTMFGTLKQLLKENIIEKKENHIIQVTTKNEYTYWEIFSLYHVITPNDYLRVNFATESEFNDFIKTIKERSFYDMNVDITYSDKILTLSTCYKTDERMVVHAKLIKEVKKNTDN